MLTQPHSSIPRPALAKFCRRNRISHLGLFGSALRDDFRPDSDVDVLVEFEPGAQVSLFMLAHVQGEISTLLGRPVDLGPRHSLKRVIRDSELASEQVFYEA